MKHSQRGSGEPKRPPPVAIVPPPLLPDLQPQGWTLNTFRDLFRYLYIDGHWYALLTGEKALKVRFTMERFYHAFFKDPTGGYARTKRQPARVMRLLWIGHAVENPSEVWKKGASTYLFYLRTTDSASPWYLVVVDREAEGKGKFITAHDIESHQSYLGTRAGAVRVF